MKVFFKARWSPHTGTLPVRLSHLTSTCACAYGRAFACTSCSGCSLGFLVSAILRKSNFDLAIDWELGTWIGATVATLLKGMVAAELEYSARPELSTVEQSSFDDQSPEHALHGTPYEASSTPSLGRVVRLERRSTPTWLKALLLLVHLLPLVLIAARSGVLPQAGLESVQHAGRALFVLLVLMGVAELVNNEILPLPLLLPLPYPYPYPYP